MTDEEAREEIKNSVLENVLVGALDTYQTFRNAGMSIEEALRLVLKYFAI